MRLYPSKGRRRLFPTFQPNNAEHDEAIYFIIMMMYVRMRTRTSNERYLFQHVIMTTTLLSNNNYLIISTTRKQA